MKKMLLSAFALALICNVSFGQATAKVDPKDPAYSWDFTHIYPSWDVWQQELKAYSELTPKFLEYKGKISKDPKALLDYIKLSEKAGQIGSKLFWYVRLQGDVDGKNPIYRAKQQELQTVSIEMSKNSTWYSSELATIPQETCNKWMSEMPELAIYKHDFDDFYRERAHILDEKTQNILNEYSRSLGAPLRIYNSLAIADIEFPKVTLSTGEVVTASPAVASRIYATSNIS